MNWIIIFMSAFGLLTGQVIGSGSTGSEGQQVGSSGGSGQKLKIQSLNTQDIIQIHLAHNFINFGPIGMYVAPNERPTPWISFSIFYVWKYAVLHPVKIEE